MMNDNFCMCGVQAGYPHYAECPYPLFRGTEQDEQKWMEAKTRKGKAMLRITISPMINPPDGIDRLVIRT